jgi:hypothetical protein
MSHVSSIGAVETAGTLPACCKQTPTNEQLNFALAGYCNPAALPGAVPSQETARDSLGAMKRRARYQAFVMGMPQEDVWEEGLARTLLNIAESRLTEKYRPSNRGVAPYINRIIYCRVGDVVAERRGYKPLPPADEMKGHGQTPLEAAEFSDLLAKCNEIVASSSNESLPPARTVSTERVRAHRSRIKLQNAMRQLFDTDTSFGGS